ncbi:hypothetical protein AAY473_032162 [Plecturocebus cupreus]
MVAISFSVSALLRRGLILKKSFIHGQCLTFMNERMLYWMQKMDSLKTRLGLFLRETPPPSRKSSCLNKDPAEPPLHHLLEFHTHEKPSAHSLCPGDQFGQAVIPHLFQGSQQASLEEHLMGQKGDTSQFPGEAVSRGQKGQHLSELTHYLGVSKFVLSVVNINGCQKLFTSFLAVNELSLRDRTGIQHSTWKSSQTVCKHTNLGDHADADALQDAVTAQLVQDKAVFHCPWEQKQDVSLTQSFLKTEHRLDSQQHEHVVVEKLLQFLVGEVDAQLLQAVVLTTKYNMGSHHVGQAGLELPTSGDLPALASKVLGLQA